MLNASTLKAQFPLFDHHPDLVYLDNAATTQKPRCVLDAERHYYETANANVHRGAHRLAVAATDAFENARQSIARFLHARTADEIVLTRGTTEAINLVANTFGAQLQAGDEILISTLEHHANIVPWQMLAQRSGVVLRIIGLDETGAVDLADLQEKLGNKTRLVAISHVSNAIGSIQPIARICALAHAAGARVLVDGAQAVAHLPIDVQALDCDFYAFSGHKVYGPTGIGVLWARSELLHTLPPWQGGGEMIEQVRFERSSYAAPPYRFEAGTPAIAQTVGLGAALDWLAALDRPALALHEQQLHQQLEAGLRQIAGVYLHGTAADKAPLSAMTFANAHPYDVAQFLDARGIAVRVGHHCAQPLLHYLGINASLRISLAAYNTASDVDAVLAALADTLEILA